MRLGFGMMTLAAIVIFAESQTLGTVLTVDDAGSGFLFRRPFPTEGRTWMGLFATPERSIVRRLNARWTVELDASDSIFSLALDSDVPTILVADVPQITPGPATTLTPSPMGLTSEERTRELVLGAATYTLGLAASDPMLCDAVVTLSDGTRSQRLYGPEDQTFSCDEPHFTLDWAGDLDGDGRLDIVTTLSLKYSYYPRRLYLSSAASGNDLVGLVARYDGGD